MLASAELALGFVLVFVVMAGMACVGTVVLIFRGFFGVLGFICRGGHPAPRKRVTVVPVRQERLESMGSAGAAMNQVCANAHCGCPLRPEARYCARCGQRVRPR